eukprot:2627381-Rhodomonas_salina.1
MQRKGGLLQPSMYLARCGGPLVQGLDHDPVSLTRGIHQRLHNVLGARREHQQAVRLLRVPFLSPQHLYDHEGIEGLVRDEQDRNGCGQGQRGVHQSLVPPGCGEGHCLREAVKGNVVWLLEWIGRQEAVEGADERGRLEEAVDKEGVEGRQGLPARHLLRFDVVALIPHPPRRVALHCAGKELERVNIRREGQDHLPLFLAHVVVF